jgi:hypothetical protein
MKFVQQRNFQMQISNLSKHFETIYGNYCYRHQQGPETNLSPVDQDLEQVARKLRFLMKLRNFSEYQAVLPQHTGAGQHAQAVQIIKHLIRSTKLNPDCSGNASFSAFR